MVAQASAAARERPHAVVVGSGFGGLAAAVRLRARGYRVTVLEKRAPRLVILETIECLSYPWVQVRTWILALKLQARDVDRKSVV